MILQRRGGFKGGKRGMKKAPFPCFPLSQCGLWHSVGQLRLCMAWETPSLISCALSFSLEQDKSFIWNKTSSKHWPSKWTNSWHSTPIFCKSRVDARTAQVALLLENVVVRQLISFAVQFKTLGISWLETIRVEWQIFYHPINSKRNKRGG